MSGTKFSPNLYIPVFGLTLFLSAFLLFSIQPLFGKMVLPLLGGAPMVWNTAMLFYQAVLLLGYAYAHITSRFLNIKMQALLHLTLFTIFAFVLPFLVDKGVEPPVEPGKLISWQIVLMTLTIGGPFFVLSGCAPMLQYWFSKTGHKDAGNPYFLYGASNIGSMLALLSYPFLFEPTLTVPMQSLSWSYGYYTLIGMVALSALFVWGSHNKSKDPAMQPLDKKTDEKLKPSTKVKLTWLLLAFLPSSLMLGVTTHISTDLAAFPLLWIIPLALYVGTFIIVFSKNELLSLDQIQKMHLYFFIALIFMFIGEVISNKYAVILLHFVTFFLSALLCHKQLERLKPDPHYLTEFYLIMSVGGVCGGIFNALIAPNLFLLPIEYGFILGLITFMRYMEKDDQSLGHLKAQLLSKSGLISLGIIGFFIACIQFAYTSQFASVIFISMFGLCIMLTFVERQRWIFGIASIAILLISQTHFKHSVNELLHLDRNFFGVTKVYDDPEGGNVRLFLHGTTLHGAQPLPKDKKMDSITYYMDEGPAGNVFELLADQNEPHKIGAIGLGIGSVACFTAPGRSFDFFEIDSAVQEIAENEELFTYLSDCGSPYEIILGDARLKLQKEEDNKYDLIFMDAFSSDNIPIHLLTREAFKVYFDKLKDDGIIVVHVSNRYLDLRPLINSMAEEFSATALFKNQIPEVPEDKDEPQGYYMQAIYTMMSRNPESLSTLKEKYGWEESEDKAPKIWTDDYANPLSLLLMGAPVVHVQGDTDGDGRPDEPENDAETTVEGIE